MQDSIRRLFRSESFWTLILDVIVSSVLFFVGKYASVSAFEDVQFLIGVLQPIFVLLIAAFTVKDASKARSFALLAESLYAMREPERVEAKGIILGIADRIERL